MGFDSQASWAEASKKPTSRCRNAIVVTLPSHWEGHRDSDGGAAILISRRGTATSMLLPSPHVPRDPPRGRVKKRNARFVPGILSSCRCLIEDGRTSEMTIERSAEATTLHESAPTISNSLSQPESTHSNRFAPGEMPSWRHQIRPSQRRQGRRVQSGDRVP